MFGNFPYGFPTYGDAASAAAPPPEVHAHFPISRLRERPRLEPLWLTEVELRNGGPVLYLADRPVTVTGRRYEDYVSEVSGLSEGLEAGAGAEAGVRFRNEPYKSYDSLIEMGGTYPFEGAPVTIKECCLDDGAPSEAATLFRGVLGEPREAGPGGFAFSVLSVESAKDRQWKQGTVNTDDYPNAHEDVGRVEPIIYGSGILAPALRVDWGARTTLQAEISATATSMSLSDAARFPSSGSVWVDDEKIGYSGKSGNTLTGLSRAQGGTTATPHRAGADAAQAKAAYDSLLAGHELHGVGDIFAEIEGALWRVASGVSAVCENGKHLLRATGQITVKAVADGVAVSDDISVSVGGSNKKVYPNSHNVLSGSVSNPGNAYDGNEVTAAQLQGGATQTNFEVKFPGTGYGAIQTQYVHARILGNTLVGGGWTPSSVNPSVAGWFRFQKSGGNWGDSITFASGGSYPNYASPYIYEVYKEVEYTASASKSGSAYRTGGIVATHSVERFHAVVSGYKDDASGTYTGTPGALIERPDHVIKHFLVERMGFAPSEIDTASFDAAGSAYASAVPGGYKFAFRIGEKIKPSEFLRRMARECRSTLRYSRGAWRLDSVPDSAPPAVKTIAGEELAGEGAKFNFSKTPLRDVANDLTARYMRRYSRMRGDSEWDATASASDAASQAKYGLYHEAVDFELIREPAMASHVLAHMLLERKEPRLAVEFPVFWEHFDLAPGDTVEIESPPYAGRKFFIESIRRLDKFRAEIKAVEWG